MIKAGQTLLLVVFIQLMVAQLIETILLRMESTDIISICKHNKTHTDNLNK